MPDNFSSANAALMLNAGTGTNMAFIALAVGDPGSAGTANPSSVTTRMSVTWGSPSNTSNTETIAASNQPQWASWAGTNGEVLTDLAFWSLVTAGAFGCSMPLSAPVTMDTGDSVTLTSLSVSIPTAS